MLLKVCFKRTFGKNNDQETSRICWTRACSSGSETRSFNILVEVERRILQWQQQNSTEQEEEKKSIARVYFVPGTGKITINKRDIDEYFGLETLKVVVRQPLVATETVENLMYSLTLRGGGYTGQAGAIRHGIQEHFLKQILLQTVLKK